MQMKLFTGLHLLKESNTSSKHLHIDAHLKLPHNVSSSLEVKD